MLLDSITPKGRGTRCPIFRGIRVIRNVRLVGRCCDLPVAHRPIFQRRLQRERGKDNSACPAHRHVLRVGTCTGSNLRAGGVLLNFPRALFSAGRRGRCCVCVCVMLHFPEDLAESLGCAAVGGGGGGGDELGGRGTRSWGSGGRGVREGGKELGSGGSGIGGAGEEALARRAAGIGLHPEGRLQAGGRLDSNCIVVGRIGAN